MHSNRSKTHRLSQLVTHHKTLQTRQSSAAQEVLSPAMSKPKDSMSLMVKNYLQKANRPYSPMDVFNNMNSKDSKLSKTAVVRALEELAAQQVIKEKINGKQKIYFADQDVFQKMDETELKQIDDKLQHLSERYQQMRAEIKAKEDKVTPLKNSVSSEQLAKRLDQIQLEVNDLEKRLKEINTKAQDFDPELQKKVKNERQSLVKEWRKRKRLANDIIDTILEDYPKSKKSFYEELEIETDEEVNAVLPKI